MEKFQDLCQYDFPTLTEEVDLLGHLVISYNENLESMRIPSSEGLYWKLHPLISLGPDGI